MSFANFTTSKGNSAGLASGIPRKTNAFQVESNSKDSIDINTKPPEIGIWEEWFFLLFGISMILNLKQILLKK